MMDCRVEPGNDELIPACNVHAKPNPPGEECDNSPGTKPGGEGDDGLAFDGKPERHGEGQHSEAAERGAGGIERRRLAASPLARHPGLTFAAPFVRLDQGRACAEDGGQREKQTTNRRPEIVAYHAREDRRDAAQRKANDILVPAAVFEGCDGQPYQHQAPPNSACRLKATISQTGNAASVAISAFNRARIKSWQTTML
jgi:hypothetical protein